MKQWIRGVVGVVAMVSLGANEGSWQDIFERGTLQGGVRSHYFLSDKGENHSVYGLGGHLLWQSYPWYHLSMRVGLYGDVNPWHMSDEDAVLYKSGKDVLNRYDVLTYGKYGLLNVAQASLSYVDDKIDVRFGRQIFESFLTKANDSKMVPNTFEGVSVSWETAPKRTFKMAYLWRQKLRDHNSFHHLLAYGESSSSDPYGKYLQNDDSYMHKGLTLSALKAAGIEDRLWVFDGVYKRKEGFSWAMNLSFVPELLAYGMAEVGYAWVLPTFRLYTSGRYFYQDDRGAGRIGGANLQTNTVGYKDPTSLDASLYALKCELSFGAHFWHLGYSSVANKGDFVTPWRGLPTSGYTRAMSQGNWYANTKSTMLSYAYDFSKSHLVEGLKIKMGYVWQDFDDTKAGVQADSNVFTIDIVKKIASIQGLLVKLRLIDVKGDSQTIAQDGTRKDDPSYDALRFEIKYTF